MRLRVLVRVRVQGRVHELHAVEEEDPEVSRELIEEMLIKYLCIEAEHPQPVAGVTPEAERRAYGLLPAVLRKYNRVETSRARFVPSPERFPGTQIRHGIFRVDPAHR